jgi:hypothetical protein
MTNQEKRSDDIELAMSSAEFAMLGGGEFAYIRQLDSQEAGLLFPTMKGLPKGLDLYALVAADGTPLTLTDSFDAAFADAIEHDLEPVSVH